MSRSEGTKRAEQAWNQGKGIPHDIKPIAVKFPGDVDAVLRSLPDRSERIRQWVIAGMKSEGLL